MSIISRGCLGGLRFIAPFKWIDYGVYGDLIYKIPKAIFHVLKGTTELQDNRHCLAEDHQADAAFGQPAAAAGIPFAPLALNLYLPPIMSPLPLMMFRSFTVLYSPIMNYGMLYIYVYIYILIRNT